MIYTREIMIRKLAAYPEGLRKIALLRYELEHPARISFTDMMEAMNFARDSCRYRSGGTASNKTLYIALNYRQQADQINSDAANEIVTQLGMLEQETKRLEYYVSLLEQRKAEVVRMSFFEQLSWNTVAQSMGVAVRTAQSIRVQAVDELVEMYNLTADMR